jgi:hypothetical protein
MAEPRRGWGTLAAVVAGAALLALAAWLVFRQADVDRDGAAPTMRPPAAAVGGMLQGSKIGDAKSAAGERLPVFDLKLPQSVTVGKIDAATYTITSATVEPRNAESTTLLLQVRMRNTGPYPTNFWDASFRLVAHDAVIPASGGLNALVEGRSDSALERVQFVVPRSSVPRALRIEHAGETTEVPLQLR